MRLAASHFARYEGQSKELAMRVHQRGTGARSVVAEDEKRRHLALPRELPHARKRNFNDCLELYGGHVGQIMVVARRLDDDLVTPLRWQRLFFDWMGRDPRQRGKSILDNARAPAAFFQIRPRHSGRSSIADAAAADRAGWVIRRPLPGPCPTRQPFMMAGPDMPGGSDDSGSARQWAVAQLTHGDQFRGGLHQMRPCEAGQ